MNFIVAASTDGNDVSHDIGASLSARDDAMQMGRHSVVTADLARRCTQVAASEFKRLRRSLVRHFHHASALNLVMDDAKAPGLVGTLATHNAASLLSSSGLLFGHMARPASYTLIATVQGFLTVYALVKALAAHAVQVAFDAQQRFWPAGLADWAAALFAGARWGGRKWLMTDMRLARPADFPAITALRSTAVFYHWLSAGCAGPRDNGDARSAKAGVLFMRGQFLSALLAATDGRGSHDAFLPVYSVPILPHLC